MSHVLSDTNESNKREGGIMIPFSILTDKNLTNTEKHIYAYILAFNVNGLDFFSSSEATGEKLGINPVQVRRAIADLCKLGYLIRVQSLGCSVLRCNKSLQTTDPIVTNRIAGCNESLQGAQQIVTHNNNINNNYNNKNNNNQITNSEALINQSQTLINQNSELESPRELNSTTKSEEPPPKSSAKKVPPCQRPECKPRPDTEDQSLVCRMTDQEWDKFVKLVGYRCALKLCEDFESWDKNKKAKDHFKTLRNWNQMKLAKRLVFGFNSRGGWGYYDQYTKDLVLEEDYREN